MGKLAQNRSFKFMGGIEDAKQNIQFFSRALHITATRARKSTGRVR
jgi:hypothetical protein